MVSGALDAWRYRDANAGAFGVYWRKVVAQGAQGAQSWSEPEATEQAHPVVEPDERELVRGWAEASGGRVIDERALAELAPAMAESLAPASEKKLAPSHAIGVVDAALLAGTRHRVVDAPPQRPQVRNNLTP